MKTILIICYSPLHRDPRVLRQVVWLKEHFSITTSGLTSPMIKDVDFIELSNCYNTIGKKIFRMCKLIFKLYEWAYWSSCRKSQFDKLKEINCDLIILNDMDSLQIGVRLANFKNVPIIFDAHEYYPEFSQNRSLFNLLKTREIIFQIKKYLNGINLITTVSEGIQLLYEKHFGIKSILIRNTTEYYDLNPSLISDSIDIVHHGGAIPGREIEKMIGMMKYLDSRFTLHFYLISGGSFTKYLDYLKKISIKYGDKIVFHKPVKTTSIPEEINKYDIGLFLLPPTNTNYKYALPNKFFEFIQGRLAIAIGPSPEMVKYVKKYNLGLVSNDFTPLNLAKMLSEISIKEIKEYKMNSHKNAFKLSSNIEKSKLIRSVINLLD